MAMRLAKAKENWFSGKKYEILQIIKGKKEWKDENWY